MSDPPPLNGEERIIAIIKHNTTIKVSTEISKEIKSIIEMNIIFLVILI